MHEQSDVEKPAGPRRRRRHSREFKQRLIAACQQPGVSIASVAMDNRVNANLLRRWVTDAAQFDPVVVDAPAPHSAPTAMPRFMALELAESGGGAIEVEIKRGTTTIRMRWPEERAMQWLRELLR